MPETIHLKVVSFSCQLLSEIKMSESNSYLAIIKLSISHVNSKLLYCSKMYYYGVYKMLQSMLGRKLHTYLTYLQ